MPPIEWGEHLIAYLFECGPVLSTGMGVVPICDGDLLAWRENRGVALTPWESDMIVKMSRAYSNGLTQYADTAAMPPWTPPIDEVKAKQATDAFASWAKRMASR